MLVVDACYAGVGRSGEALLEGSRFAVPASRPDLDAAEWAAAGADELAGPLEAVEHGAFTYFAVGALRGWADGELGGGRDGAVTGAEAQAYVSRMLRARQVVDQRPALRGASDWTLSAGAELGPGSAPAAAPLPDPPTPPAAREREARSMGMVITGGVLGAVGASAATAAWYTANHRTEGSEALEATLRVTNVGGWGLSAVGGGLVVLGLTRPAAGPVTPLVVRGRF